VASPPTIKPTLSGFDAARPCGAGGGPTETSATEATVDLHSVRTVTGNVPSPGRYHPRMAAVKVTRTLHHSGKVGGEGLDETVPFYQHLLDSVNDRPPTVPRGSTGMVIGRPRQKLHLVDAGPGGTGIRTSRGHVCFAVEDLAGGIAELEATGHPYLDGAQGDRGSKSGVVDPAGNTSRCQQDTDIGPEPGPGLRRLGRRQRSAFTACGSDRRHHGAGASSKEALAHGARSGAVPKTPPSSRARPTGQMDVVSHVERCPVDLHPGRHHPVSRRP